MNCSSVLTLAWCVFVWSSGLDSIVLIIFNYDRCIEHYLYHSIQNYYQISAEDVAKLLQSLEVYHPYGTVGSLPWLNSDRAIAFGDLPSVRQLLELASKIKTFTEGTDELSSDVKAIRAHMKTANKLVFLGFAFHRLNLELLLPESESMKLGKPPTGRIVYATAYGISPSNTSLIAGKLESRETLREKNIHIRNDLKCSGLIGEYSGSLTFA